MMGKRGKKDAEKKKEERQDGKGQPMPDARQPPDTEKPCRDESKHRSSDKVEKKEMERSNSSHMQDLLNEFTTIYANRLERLENENDGGNGIEYYKVG